MYDIVLDINAVLVWYVLLVIGILGLTAFASWRHKKPILFVWGMLMGVLILWLREYLAPIVFGFMNYSWESQPVLFALTGVFAVGWFGYIGITLYNAIVKGELVA